MMRSAVVSSDVSSNIRTLPSVNSPSIGNIPKESTLARVSDTTTPALDAASKKYTWFYIQIGEVTGYFAATGNVSVYYIDTEPPASEEPLFADFYPTLAVTPAVRDILIEILEWLIRMLKAAKF